jgi:group I intron endonuclease
MVVYETINKINGKRYIGKDKYNDPTYIGSGRILSKAIKKYGKENFIKLILEHCTSEEDLNQKEKYWIAITDAQTSPLYYNIGPGGNGGDNISNNPNKNSFIEKMLVINRKPRTNTKHSEFTKENQSKAAVGRYTLDWFKNKYGDVLGSEKYFERNAFLKSRTSNVVDNNREQLDLMIKDRKYKIKDIYEHFQVSAAVIYRKLDQWYGCKNLKECRDKLNLLQ